MKIRKKIAQMLDKDTKLSTGSTVQQALKESKFFEFRYQANWCNDIL